ncbi:glycosyltransferase [Mycobacterium sp. MBM]|nr:glycosyltransferase [Mycobacterium sp. MBM]
MMPIRRVEVVVPARDEQAHIAECLHSLVRSMTVMHAESPQVSCAITVVLNCCTDATAEIVGTFGVHVLTSDADRIGSVRRSGVADAISRARRAGVEPDALWIACTDADTVVPGDWLHRQVEFADSGLDAVIGTVTPGDISPQLYQRWLRDHDLSEGHDHVHGANLGFRADVYLRAGGFPEVESHEDVGLVDRIRAVTSRWTATHQTSVLTSGRRESRVSGGFGSYIADLEAEAAP